MCHTPVKVSETFCFVIWSAENGEKAEKEGEAPPEEEAVEEEEKKVKPKVKKGAAPAEEGFELWNELEVQRIKFMVRLFKRSPLCKINLLLDWVVNCK